LQQDLDGRPTLSCLQDASSQEVATGALQSLYFTFTRDPVVQRGVCDDCLVEELDLYNVRWGTTSTLMGLCDLCSACKEKCMDDPVRTCGPHSHL
jgi:hypothetical protein